MASQPEVTMFSRFGYEIENRDALDRYTSATYGYNNSLPTAISANARYREIGFASFEDFGVNTNCNVEHFGFGIKPESAHSHTGSYSLQVKSKNRIILSKDLILCDEMEKLKEDNN